MIAMIHSAVKATAVVEVPIFGSRHGYYQEDTGRTTIPFSVDGKNPGRE